MKARWHWVLMPSLALSLCLLLASQIAFLRGSFFRDLRLGRMGTDLTLANYERFFTDTLYVDSLLLTIRLSFTVALLTPRMKAISLSARPQHTSWVTSICMGERRQGLGS